VGPVAVDGVLPDMRVKGSSPACWGVVHPEPVDVSKLYAAVGGDGEGGGGDGDGGGGDGGGGGE